MSGLGLVLNTARLAIAAQQQGLTVSSHNIANVNSPYYSRQSAVHSPRDPISYGRYWLGSGVEMAAVQRSADQLLENRLIDIRADLASSEEMATYMDIFETVLNENSESALSSLMVEFWNAWHGVSNNPTRAPERVAVYEKGVETAERFDTLANDLLQVEVDLNSELSAILTEVGSICSQIATLNNELIGQEITNISHDMLDERNGLVNELTQLIGIKTFQQPDGSLIINTAGGFTLVNGADSLALTFDTGRINWEGSFGGKIDITDKISGGKIGGWLEMRDEVIAKYRTELDALAKEYIWTVNYQHSQGVGLSYFDAAVTGTYATDPSGRLDTLTFGHKIDYTEDFKMYVNTSGSDLYPFVTVDMDISSSAPSFGGTAADVGSTYTITLVNSGTIGGGGADRYIDIEWVSSSTGDSGTSTLLTGNNAVVIDGMTLTFGLGDLVAGNTLTVNTVAAGATAGDPAPVSLSGLSGTANSILDTYQFTVSSATGNGEIGAAGDTITISWSNSIATGSFTLDSTTTSATVDGMTLTFGAGGRCAIGDVFTITTDNTGTPTESMMSDWHWTLDSFTDQFNRDATAAGMGVTATKTTDNRITFTPGANNSIGFPGSYTMAEQTSNDGSLIDAGTMSVLAAGELTLNGASIRAAAAGDDTASSADNAGSAIAIAAAINASTSTTGVRAYAEKTRVDLGIASGYENLTPGDFSINGQAITGAVSDAGTLVSVINSFSGATGVTASAVGDYVTLTAVDGRNIQLQTDGTMAGAMTFSNFDLDGGAPLNQVIRGNVTLYSESTITIGGADPAAVGFNAGSIAPATSTDSGLTAAFGVNTFFSGDDCQSMAVNSVLENKDHIAAATIDTVNGQFGVGDNSNANRIADLKFSTRSIAEWTYRRGSDTVSQENNFFLEDYYHKMVGSISVQSANAHRSVSFNETLAEKLGEQRDNLSGVSLDEEMINMMKYQHAYNAASKLLTVADEMLEILISTR